MNIDFENIFVQVPTYIFWKDRNSTYLGCNAANANSCGLSSVNEIIGKTDFDLCWHQFAHVFREGDQAVLDNANPYPRYETISTSDLRVKTIITQKKLLHDKQGKLIGLIGSYHELLDTSYYGKFDPKKMNISLTKRQLDCILKLVEGMTAKQIALHLNISQRTVEHYIESLKIKFNCRNKYELIKKAMTFNFIREKVFSNFSK